MFQRFLWTLEEHCRALLHEFVELLCLREVQRWRFMWQFIRQTVVEEIVH